jgi:hypothetical protein
MLPRQSFSHKNAKSQIEYGNLFVSFMLFCGEEQIKRDRPRGRSLLENTRD